MNPYLGELRVFAFGVIPRGWLPCNGQLLAISTNTALFSILGTQYGGNGVSTFQLPNLQGRMPRHCAIGEAPGTLGGLPTATLKPENLPLHGHNLQIASIAATVPGAKDDIISDAGEKLFAPLSTAADLKPMSTTAIASSGAATPINIMQPYLGVSVCIAISGIYPSRN